MPAQGAIFIKDVSGNTALLDTSGRFQIAGTLTANVSGQSVFLGSGSVLGLSGLPVQLTSGGLTVGVVTAGSGAATIGAVSVASGNISIQSGAISVVSGSITVNSGQIAVSGLYSAATLISGAAGISGIGAVGLFIYDYSGAAWTPLGTMTSGSATVNNRGIPTGGTIQTFLQQGMNLDNISAVQFALQANAGLVGFEPVAGIYGRVRANVSGDGFRLRVSTEGRAPTYTVNANNISLFSGGAVQVAPYIALMNFGSGSATPVYKIKSLFIGPDPANTVASGQAIKWDIIRFTGFSGGGTLLSGVAHDTSDPAYSGTLAGPTLQKNVGSGVTLDAVYFSYVGTTEGPFVEAAGLGGTFNTVFDPNTTQLLNLVGVRMQDTKEIVIRSGYGFGVVQSSGAGYTQLLSGTYNFSMTYSVEG